MRLWLESQLDRQHIQNLALANANAKTWEEICIILARAGDPVPLRKLYPQFADCIHSPKLRQGQRYPKQRMQLTITETAARLARRIRALWRAQYGRRNRRRDEKSAEDFAIDICKEWFPQKAARLTVGAVLAAGKPSGKHAKPRRKFTRQMAQVAR